MICGTVELDHAAKHVALKRVTVRGVAYEAGEPLGPLTASEAQRMIAHGEIALCYDSKGRAD